MMPLMSHSNHISSTTTWSADVTVRRAGPADDPALRRLAALDSAAPLQGPVLIALVDGAPAAAVALTGERAIADPFRPTADLVALLATRRAQLAGGGRRRRYSPRKLASRAFPASVSTDSG